MVVCVCVCVCECSNLVHVIIFILVNDYLMATE